MEVVEYLTLEYKKKHLIFIIQKSNVEKNPQKLWKEKAEFAFLESQNMSP